MLVILTPRTMTDPTETARQLLRVAGKPVRVVDGRPRRGGRANPAGAALRSITGHRGARVQLPVAGRENLRRYETPSLA
jgi:hypothetical protein